MFSHRAFVAPLNALLLFSLTVQVIAAPSTLRSSFFPIPQSALEFGVDYTKDPFPPYPAVTNPDGTNVSALNLRGTRLYGWKGCDVSEEKIIAQTYDDFYTLAQQSSLYKNLDFSSVASRELWGPSTGKNRVKDDRKKEIVQIYAAAQQIYSMPWWLWPTPDWVPHRKLWIEVRCSGGDGKGDPDNVCGDKKPNDGRCPKRPDGSPGNMPPDGKDNLMEAWSNPSGKFSQITFCNRFFNNLGSLQDVVAAGKKQPKDAQDNLEIWNNRARTFFHEITHLTYFMNTPGYGPNVEDMQIKYKKDRNTITEGAYGPYYVKLLRNYVSQGTGGFYTQRNADTYAWFALAEYVTSQIGFYPTKPNPGSVKPIEAPKDPDGNPITVTAADLALDPGTDMAIGANPDDDLIGTAPYDAEFQTVAGFAIPGCPDNYPSPAVAAASSTITSAPAGPSLYCSNPSLEDSDGICTCTQGTVTKTITPAGGPGAACPTAI